MFWNKVKRSLPDMNNFSWGSIGSINIESDEMKETTYFKCIKYISESVAKCPIVIKQDTKDGEIVNKSHRLYNKLTLRPNPYMTAIDCMKAFIALGEHNGISGLFIDRSTMDLYPAKINQIIIDTSGLIGSNLQNKVLYEFSIANSLGYCFEEDIILYKPGITFDGINTRANKDLLKKIIGTNIKGQEYLSKLFDNGLTNKIVVQLTSDIKDEKELKKIQQKFKRIYNNDGRVFTVPAGYGASTLNLSLADVQFEQIRKLSRREIAVCFGLTPSQIGDLSDSNNNNMEMQNIGFLTDTLLVKFEQIEQEFTYKYLSTDDLNNGFKCRVNESVLLRTDPKTQEEILTSYVKNSIYPPNRARQILGEPLHPDGDDLLVPSGTYKLKDLTQITLSKLNLKGGGNDEGEGNKTNNS